VRGNVTINANAASAVRNGRASLLSSGVTACDGRWTTGQVIAIHDADGRNIGKGIAEIDAHQLTSMLTSGAAPRGVLVRRENLLLDLVKAAKEHDHAGKD